MTVTHRIFLCFVLIAVGTSIAAADDAALPDRPGVWPVERLKSNVPNFRIEDRSAKIQSLIYEGESINGAATEVFAFYGSPRTLGKPDGDAKYPGIILIHGGGGTAFADWVWMWAHRGYAALAMDLGGCRPPAPEYDANGMLVPHTRHSRDARVRLARGGVPADHDHKFASIGGTIDDDWPFHAVANVIRAHTLLRSFQEVDPDRTAVTGISWGGYTTCLVASHDDRFKAAVPVYGCGFLHEGESVQKPAIDKLGERRAAWVAAYDPGSHLEKCVVPTLWVNGTHDVHYVLDSYAKSYAQVTGPRTIRIQPHMPHGHISGWQPPEIQIFIDSILNGGTPLAKVGPMKVDADGSVTVPFESDVQIVKAELHFTTDSGLRSDRKWGSSTATITNATISNTTASTDSVSGGTVTATGLPPEANTWLIVLTDTRGAIVSSEVGFR